MLLVLSVTLFVISMIAALIMLIIGKNINTRVLLGLTSIHFIFLLISIWSYSDVKAAAHELTSSHVILLLTLCSGFILFGAWLRQKKYPFFKFYFGLYLISLIFFIRSPGRFFAFIYTGDKAELKEQSIQISGPYYLSKQNNTSSTTSSIYKVYIKKGLLTYTLRSGLEIPGELKGISQVNDDADSLHFYAVFEKDLTLDSVLWAAPLNPKGNTEITKGTGK